MKIAVLFYHSVYDDEVHAMLDRLQFERYVEVPAAWAQDGAEKRFGTHIYPGTDAVVVSFVEDARAAALVEAVREFQKGRQKEHTHLAVLAAETFV